MVDALKTTAHPIGHMTYTQALAACEKTFFYLFLFTQPFEQNSFQLRCETDIGFVLCYRHQACCLLYYLYEISSKNGIHIYLSKCNCGFGFEQKYWRINGFGEKLHGFTSLYLVEIDLCGSGDSTAQERNAWQFVPWIFYDSK